MGNLCSKRKNSDSQSVRSDGSKRASAEGLLDNHSSSSKRPNHQNGGASQSQGVSGERSSGSGGTEATPSTVAADTPDAPTQKAEALRNRMLKETEPSSVSGDSMSLSSPTMLNAPHADLPLPSKLPLEIKKQSENVRNLLIGRVQRVKPVQKCRKITLYVCASDSQDFRLEKGNLHTEVYPSLRDYCSSKGYELHITDLHWKTDLETKQDHEFPELCLEELKRQLEVSYVIPVLFLSNSLGAPLLPKTMEQQDFEMALNNVLDPSNKELLQQWYSLDTHAQPPCYRLNPITAHIPNIQSDVEEEKMIAIHEWCGIVEEILSILLRVFPTELRDTYLTTVIEQEIHNSIFMSRDVGKRSIWACRVFTDVDNSCSELPSPIEIEKNRRLDSLHNELKNQLNRDHILRLLVKWEDGGLSTDHIIHAKYLQDLTTQLSLQLKSTVTEIMEEDQSSAKGKWKPCYGIDGALCSEVMQHTVFCQQAAKCCPSIENVVNDIKLYVSGDFSHPLVVYGEKGCGKTCFLSRVIQQAAGWFPDSYLIYRFVGLTPESRSILQLLRTITSQLSFLLKGRNYWVPHTIRGYQRELYNAVSSTSLVIIVIDGLDELDSKEASELAWLAETLPPKVKLILSCSDSSAMFKVIKSFIVSNAAFISMSGLTVLTAESMLTASILQYSHSIDSEVQKRLSARLQYCALPLYIKVLAWQASIDPLGIIDISAIKDVSTAINGLFDYLERTLEKDKVELALGLMCASHYGLSDSELLDLLASIPSFCSRVTFVEWAPASIFLAQLFQRLGPFLEWSLAGDTFVVRWRDSTLYEIAKQRYLGNTEAEKKIRQLLLEYFQNGKKDKKNGRQFVTSEDSINSHYRRSLEEGPYQQFHLKGSIKASHICKVEWLRKKIQASTVYQVIEDIIMEQKGDPVRDADLTLLRQTLELSSAALNYDAQQFFGQMHCRLSQFFTGSEAAFWTSKCPFVKIVFDTSVKPSTPSFIPVSPFLHSAKELADATSVLNDPKTSACALEGEEQYANELYRMKTGNQFVVSLSTTKEEVTVWDVYTETSVRTIQGVNNPISLKVIDDHRCAILCGRELHIYNLDDGTFITKLKGVMNQKMPFYGLHDENHIVSISRNRMYVNMVNLDSGDCVTTFKVGEDRFLNSLIVSDNGKMLVCGDETQKPFPLLVWDLQSRKLLYDLRIPHHEFVTSLSAITKEGHFVCCVCREVDDPGPNFIVVYDLQSGTLFKKWKPGFSTQAIAISAQGGCVINALEDNRIIVWDLVTGTAQWSLEKHTAPPDVLKLDHKGSRCLSFDSTGRDRTVCLWDLSTGSLLSLFTPDITLTAAEVFNEGNGVVLAQKGRVGIVTLLLRDSQSEDGNRTQETFGSDQHHGKVTVLQAK